MKSPLRWIGGKKKLYKIIVSIMPNHKCYVEPFAGGLWVLLNKPKCTVEVINDINKELINFYRVLQNNYEELKKECKYLVSSRVDFNEYLNMTAEEIKNMNNIERAKRFFYLNRCSYGGKMKSYGFSNSRRSNLCCITDNFDSIVGQAHKRLKDIYIEWGDYKELIKRYDKKVNVKEKQSVLFYFDPPYDETYDYEGHKIDYNELAEELSKMKSDWILSINDTNLIRNLFSNFNILGISVSETLAPSGENSKIRKELIITNYKIPQTPDWARMINTLD